MFIPIPGLIYHYWITGNRQNISLPRPACIALLQRITMQKKHHLAERVSTYCIMARTCASIDHEGNYPKFTETEDLVKKEIDAQYDILGEYLDSI
jgi:hypothetical protein